MHNRLMSNFRSIFCFAQKCLNFCNVASNLVGQKNLKIKMISKIFTHSAEVTYFFCSSPDIDLIKSGGKS